MHWLRTVFGGAAIACAALGTTGCDKTPAPTASTTPISPATPAAAADSSPLPGIDPHAADAAGSGVPGPGSGQTAVGGLAGVQESGGAKKNSGESPAPTGGDGAASAAR